MGWLVRFSVDAQLVELVSSKLWDAGTTGILEDGAQLVAGFDDRDRANRAVVQLRAAGAAVESIEPYRWEGSSETTTVTLHPISGNERKLTITAGPTFGHGGHPTTATAIELMTGGVRPGHRVLDVGTGSGVLAVAAAALGAGPVVAVDIDPAAVDVALTNAAANGVTIIASAEPVTATPGLIGGHRFDVVVANVLLPVQRELAEAIAGVVAPGGAVITAGYLTADEAAVESLHLDALGRRRPPGGAEVEERRSLAGWAAHRFRTAGAGRQGRPGEPGDSTGSSGSSGSAVAG